MARLGGGAQNFAFGLLVENRLVCLRSHFEVLRVHSELALEFGKLNLVQDSLALEGCAFVRGKAFDEFLVDGADGGRDLLAGLGN